MIFLIFLSIWYYTAIIKQSSSYFLENFPNQFTFVIFNEVSQSNIFFVFFYIWSFKFNKIFIISRPVFCSLNSILIGSFCSSLFFSKFLLLYLIKILAAGLLVAKILLNIWEIVCFYCIITGSDNFNMISII